jgi:hypothetical protein
MTYSKYILISFLLLVQHGIGTSQNAGIGNNQPTAPLSFANIAGYKIFLGRPSFNFYDNMSRMGVQDKMLLINNENFDHAITFGNGNSSDFTGAFSLRSSDNFFSLQYQRTYVGIRNTDPAYTLDVSGRARLLWPDFAPAVGINFHEISLGGNQAPISFSAPFQVIMINNTTLLFKPMNNTNAFGIQTANGALTLNGSFGNANQFASAQTNAASVWKTINMGKYYNQAQTGTQITSVALTDANPEATLAALTRTVTLPEKGRVHVDFNVVVQAPVCTFCGNTNFEVWIVMDGVLQRAFNFAVPNGRSMNADGNSYLGLSTNQITTAIRYNDVAAGTHTISLQVRKTAGPPLNVLASGTLGSTMHIDAYTRN